MKMKEVQQVTKAICNKGFSGLRSKATRFNICCTLIGKKPAIPYCIYTQPLSASVKNDTADNLLHKDRKRKMKIVHAQNNTFANR